MKSSDSVVPTATTGTTLPSEPTPTAETAATPPSEPTAATETAATPPPAPTQPQRQRGVPDEAPPRRPGAGEEQEQKAPSQGETGSSVFMWPRAAVATDGVVAAEVTSKAASVAELFSSSLDEHAGADRAARIQGTEAAVTPATATAVAVAAAARLAPSAAAAAAAAAPAAAAVGHSGGGSETGGRYVKTVEEITGEMRKTAAGSACGSDGTAASRLFAAAAAAAPSGADPSGADANDKNPLGDEHTHPTPSSSSFSSSSSRSASAIPVATAVTPPLPPGARAAALSASASASSSSSSSSSSSAAASAGAAAAAAAASLLWTSSSSSSSPLSPSSSSPPRVVGDDRTAATPTKVGSPPLRAVMPPRRDIRRDYLTNLGLKRAVVAGPGGTRTPPLMIRRSSFTQSVENPVEEQLKDPNAGEINLEGILRVVGSLLTGGSSKKESEQPRRRCRKCEGLKKGTTTPGSASCSPPAERHSGGMLDGVGIGTTRGPAEMEVERGGATAAIDAPPCGHKQVDFAPVVSAVYVPVHSEYSDRVRRSYWNSAGEIREMVYRNMIEFDAEDYSWENVAEEEDMYFCEETGEFIHPIFFDSQEEAREVRATSSSATSSDPDTEDHVEYIKEGRKMPVMQRR